MRMLLVLGIVGILAGQAKAQEPVRRLDVPFGKGRITVLNPTPEELSVLLPGCPLPADPVADTAVVPVVCIGPNCPIDPDLLGPLAPLRLDLLGRPAMEKIVLPATDWSNGRFFTDDQGRRWGLTSGTPFGTTPSQLGGWLLPASEGKLTFVTVGGRVFYTDAP